MSNATRKRDPDGLPKQENPMEDETHYIVPRSKGNKFEERFDKCLGEMSREECLSRIQNADKVALVEIIAFIATERANIDLNGSDFLDGVILSWSLRKGEGSLKILLRKDVLRRPALDGIFRDFCLTFALNGDGRVIELRFNTLNHAYDYEFSIPPAIGRLQKLQRLATVNCKFIPPEELLKLPELEFLKFGYKGGTYPGRSYDYLNDFLFMTRLSRLKTIYISNASFRSQKAIFQWIQEHVPRLEEFSIRKSNLDLRVNEISDALSFTNTTHIHKNLTSISLFDCDMNEAGLEHLLFDVLPNFPMVSTLNVCYNNIESIRSIDRRLRKVDANAGTVNKVVLQHIWIYDNPFCNHWDGIDGDVLVKIDSEELAALCHMLRVLPTIQAVGMNCLYRYPKLWYEVILNKAGLRFLEDTRFNDPPLPLYIWPLVLERLTRRPVAYNIRDCLCSVVETACATGLFYLLRNGPVLLTESRSKKDGY